MTLFKNLILFTNHYGNLQEMLEMATFLKYVDLYLTSEWGRFYVGHPILLIISCSKQKTKEYFPLFHCQCLFSAFL
jgi:hypothetical protein